jgi:hypothetical protein
MAQQVLPRLRRRCLIGSLTAPSWKSAKNGTTIRLAGKGPRLSCSVDCKKPTPPTGWCAGRARRRPARTRVKSKPQFRAGAPGGAAPCKRSPRARRPREPEEHKEVPMESYPPPQQAAKQISHAFVAWYLSSFADIGSEWHCPCSRPRCCGISKLWPLHVGVNGVATPVPYLCRSAACHGVSIVSSKLFPSMLT